ncbi:MAG: DUF721 domain-containing protein [Candidatus Latescibacteria bacterium]|nr:DUF721 domain-containing protein [Candidatus Latescibacterota bacterium]
MLTGLISELGIEKKLAETTVCQIWDEAVGNNLSQVTSVVSIKRGKLFVRVKTPTWRNELVFLKSEIISKLNRRVGKKVVKDIIFV